MTAKRRNRSKNKPKQKAKQQAPKQLVMARPRIRVPSLQGLDRPALEWAHLLADPCNAKLVYPCYPSGNGGTVLVRFENDQVVANGATEVAAFGVWAPGFGLSTTNVTAQTSDTLGSLLTPSTLVAPGDTFLKNNGNAVRCVAACLQISYPGSELNRAGIVGIGVAPADTAILNLPTAAGGGNINATAQGYRVASQHVERMPQSIVECKWFPGEADQTAYSYPYPTAYAPGLQGRNAIIWSASGFPVSTGVRIRMVAVYEINLFSNAGIPSVQAIAPPVSAFQTSHVLRYLASKDPQWYLDTAGKVARVIGNVISYASQGFKAAGAAVNGLALMAA